MLLEQRIGGVPVHRFRLFTKDTNGVEDAQSFSASWERSAKAYSAHKNGFEVKAENWDKDSDTWKDATQEALTEGYKRAERAKNSNGQKPTEPKAPKPVISADAHAFMRGHSDLIKSVATAGRKSGIDEQTKDAVGMSAMELLTHAGYAPQEIVELVKAYIESLKAQAQGQGK